jgi:hypothetical protein
MAQKKKAKKPTRKQTAGKKPAAGQTWVVTTADRPVAEIAKELSAAGFSVEQTLDQIGVITGKSDHRAVKKARAIRGVTDVSPDPQFSVGPPNSHDTW